MRKIGLLLTSWLLILAAVSGCAQPAPSVLSTPSAPTQQPAEEGIAPETNKPPQETVSPVNEEMPLTITSPAFTDGSKIPVKYTCEGQNISPALDWSGIPTGTASLALIVDDPDAPGGVFTHWVIFNLPPDSLGLPEAVAENSRPGGALQGKNNYQSNGYYPPCPPAGAPHHYRFTLYALDKLLNSNASVTEDQVLQAMKGHILGQSKLVGIYK